MAAMLKKKKILENNGIRAPDPLRRLTTSLLEIKLGAKSSSVVQREQRSIKEQV